MNCIFSLAPLCKVQMKLRQRNNVISFFSERNDAWMNESLFWRLQLWTLFEPRHFHSLLLFQRNSLSSFIWLTAFFSRVFIDDYIKHILCLNSVKFDWMISWMHWLFTEMKPNKMPKRQSRKSIKTKIIECANWSVKCAMKPKYAIWIDEWLATERCIKYVYIIICVCVFFHIRSH